MTDTNDDVPSLRARAEEVFARSSMNADERELWLMLFSAVDQLTEDVRAYKAAIDRAAACIPARLDHIAGRRRLKLLPVEERTDV